MSTVFLCPNNMFLRNGKYHHRRRVPADLVELLGRKEVTKSLKTGKVLDATRLKNKLDSELEAFFQACRFNVLDQDVARVRLKAILSGKPVPPQDNQAGPSPQTTDTKNQPDKSPSRRRKSKKQKLLSDAINAYCREYEHGWTEKTRKEFKSQYERITHMLGNPTLNDIERSDLIEFRDALAKTKAVSTVNKYMQQISTILTHASTLQWITGNPAQRLSLKDRRREDEIRVACTNEDVNAIFEALQRDKKTFYESGNYERYWLPLLGLYTGARVNELAQLSVVDVFCEDDIPAIRITSDGGDNKRIKSASSRRDIPLHNDLLILGFMVYVSDIKTQGHKQLFPNLKPGPNGYSHYFVAKHFTGKNGWMRKKVPSVSDSITFHNFRHTVANQLKLSEEQERLIEEIMGHKNTSLSLGRYGKPYSLDIRQRAINKIEYGLLPAAQKTSDSYWDEELERTIDREYLTCGEISIEVDPSSLSDHAELNKYLRPDLNGYSRFHTQIYSFIPDETQEST